jgi:acyl-coenzyme A synthetase/AMP-(fatty) acid ligase
MELVVTDAFTAEDESNLVNELQARIGNEMVIEVVRRKSLPRTRGGKLRSVVSLKSWQAQQSQTGGED